jgi:Leucine-rich repeat (LRR) protein
LRREGWRLFGDVPFRRSREMRRLSMILIIPLVTFFIIGACAKPAVAPAPEPAPAQEPAPTPAPEPTPTPGESVTFADTKLEAAIREAIHKPEGSIQMSDLESLTTLIAEMKGIQNLAGLEYCVYLRELDLYSNNIRDLSPLASLTNLQRLYLRFNNISDLSPLASLISPSSTLSLIR